MFSGFTGAKFNNSGQFAFRGILTGIGVDVSNDQGIWSEASGSLAIVTRRGESAPGTDGVFGGNVASQLFEDPSLNEAGAVVFTARLTGGTVDSSNSQGVWSDATGSLALVARRKDQPPGTPNGVLYSFVDTPVDINDLGRVVYSATLSGTGITTANNGGVWFGTAGNVQLVARKGEQATGTPSGVVYGTFIRPTINNQNHVAFRANLAGSGVTNANDQGIFADVTGSMTLVARTGSHAPGVEVGANFRSFANPVMNDADQIVFRGLLTGAPSMDVGVWVGTPGNFSLIARSGTAAAGTPSGTLFDTISLPSINKLGQVAFSATLVGSGVNASNGEGIWATDQSGVLRLVVRAGEIWEVQPGDFRTISEVSLIGSSGNGNGRRSGFNDLGQIAFRALFMDGSQGLFVIDVVSIPEPNTVLLLVAVALYLGGARRRRP
jgi:hypothetical protein